jgi:hypothetical protein
MEINNKKKNPDSLNNSTPTLSLNNTKSTNNKRSLNSTNHTKPLNSTNSTNSTNHKKPSNNIIPNKNNMKPSNDEDENDISFLFNFGGEENENSNQKKNQNKNRFKNVFTFQNRMNIQPMGRNNGTQSTMIPWFILILLSLVIVMS